VSGRRAAQRRTIRTLVVAQVLGSVGVGAAVSVGSLLAEDLAGSASWAGVAATMTTLGAALWALPLARLAGRRGRRPALGLGWGISAAGALLAIGASVAYTVYILISDGVVGDVDPFVLAGLVLAGATVSFAVAGLAGGSLDLALSAEAWLWLALMALVSTVVAVSAFFVGLRLVGPSEAAILSTFEPPVTVALAFLVLGERLTPAQLAGGALVLAAVIVLQLPARRAVRVAPATT
jgi:uncharacterized membrane protein